MEQSFKKVIELCPDLDPEMYFQLGWLYFDVKKWKETETYLKKFLSFDRINEDHGSKAEKMLVKAKLYAHPVPFDPKPVQDLQYHPADSQDPRRALLDRLVRPVKQDVAIHPDVEPVSHRHLDRRLDVQIPPSHVRAKLRHLTPHSGPGDLR